MLKGEGGKTHMQTPFSGESIHLYYPPPKKRVDWPLCWLVPCAHIGLIAISNIAVSVVTLFLHQRQRRMGRAVEDPAHSC
jgi:hypothetical protein